MQEKLAKANLIITDRAMARAYGPDVLDAESCHVIDRESIRELNLFCSPEALFQALEPLPWKFFCICGSSNFHHLDIFNLRRLHARTGRGLQLLVLDQHMDFGRFDPAGNVLHCGNWITYGFEKNFLSRALIIGCRNALESGIVDDRLHAGGKVAFRQNPAAASLFPFLSPDEPIYLSIDTDVLSVPSDWDRGLYDLKTVLAAPFWDELKSCRLAGAFIHGHVSDGRGAWDLLRKAVFDRNSKPAMRAGPSASSRSQSRPSAWMRFTEALSEGKKWWGYGVWPKLKTSWTMNKPSLREQLEVILSFYSAVNRIRKSTS